MEIKLGFPDLLRLLDERSAAFRAAIASAPSLDTQVPTCPEWTLLDLAHHIGEGRQAWAATVAAGPEASAKSAPDDSPAPRDREALLAWLTESFERLDAALREAGPDRGCWTWWADSQSPTTVGAVARHQLQQMAVHTYDAQVTVGDPQLLPAEIAVDGVDEFLSTCCATTAAWPHHPATIDYHATEGPSWRVRLSGDGAQVSSVPTPPSPAADTSAQGTASDLVLFFYGRIPLDSLKPTGDTRIFDQLIAWDPSE